MQRLRAASVCQLSVRPYSQQLPQAAVLAAGQRPVQCAAAGCVKNVQLVWVQVNRCSQQLEIPVGSLVVQREVGVDLPAGRRPQQAGAARCPALQLQQAHT